MKNLYFLLIFGLTFYYSQGQNSPLNNYTVTGEYTEDKVIEILSDIDQQLPIRFFFKEEWMPDTSLTKSFDKVPLDWVLTELLGPWDLGYVLYKDFSVLLGRQSDLAELDAFSLEAYKEVRQFQRDEFTGEGYENVIVGDSNLRPRPSVATLRGTIYNTDNDEGIPGAALSFPGKKIGVFANKNGAYEVKVPTGTQLLVSEASGHQPLRKQITIYGDGEWDVPLSYTAYQLEEVLLEAASDRQSVTSPTIGRINISIESLKTLPNLLGEVDIINAILRLPGVSTVGESASGFNVRGGNIDQNLIVLDGSTLYNTSHLWGFFSIFNPYMVQNASLFKGHMPAQYGGRLSSVLDVSLKDGSYRRRRFQGTIGLFSSNLSINGPLKKGRNSLIASVRGATPNLFTRYSGNPEIEESSAWYLDFSSKFSQKIGENGKLSVFGLASTDFFRFSQSLGYEWRTFSGGINFQQLFKDKFLLKVDLNGSDYASNIFNGAVNQDVEVKTGISNYKARAQVLITSIEKHNIVSGIEGNLHLLKDVERFPFGDNSNTVQTVFPRDKGLELGFYVNDEFEINSFVGFSAGLRFSLFNNLGPFTVQQYAEGQIRSLDTIIDSVAYGSGSSIQTFSALEPRLSARFLVNENASFKLSYNRVNQFLHLLSNTSSATPIDLWQVSNTYFPAQRSDSYSLGFFYNDDFKFFQKASVELFYKDLQGQVVPKDFANLLSAPYIETEIIPAVGRAFGAELAFKGGSDQFDYDGSISYIRSFRRTIENPGNLRINGGEWFPSDFDAPWNGNISLKYKLARNKSVAANFVYRSGRPVSIPTGGVFRLFPSWTVPIFTERNAYRIPDYHRLDLSFTFQDRLIKSDKIKTDFTFSIYNVYGRRNPFSIFLEKDLETFRVFQLSVLGTVLPFVSYNFRY